MREILVSKRFKILSFNLNLIKHVFHIILIRCELKKLLYTLNDIFCIAAMKIRIYVYFNQISTTITIFLKKIQKYVSYTFIGNNLFKFI